MSLFYLYCDAAGGKDHGFIVVAGYLSTFEKWNVFTGQWNKLLAAFDVPYFHMKEFAQFKGPFKDFRDEPKRARFMERAAAIIAGNVERGFSSIVPFDWFNKVNATYHMREQIGNPYALAARTCVARAGKIIGRKDLTCIFEDGDKGKGDLMRLMENHGYPLPIFRPSRDKETDGIVTRGAVPLQAADFASYEMRRNYRDDPQEIWPLEKYRKSFLALAAINSQTEDWGLYNETDLVRLCQNLKITLREKSA